jgi:hypothetical protein
MVSVYLFLLYCVGILIFYSLGMYFILKYNTNTSVIIIYSIHLMIVSILLGWYPYFIFYQMVNDYGSFEIDKRKYYDYA